MNFFNAIAGIFCSRKDTTFAAGDEIEAFGNRGKVKGFSKNGMWLEVQIDGAPGTMIFYSDGRLHSWDKKPSLKKK